MLDSLVVFFTQYGYFAVFFMLLLCGFGMPIPEDVVLVAGGVMTGLACPDAHSFMLALAQCNNVHTMVIVSMCGVLIGDLTILTLGRKLGAGIMRTKWFKQSQPENRFELLRNKVSRYGAWIVFAARFMPGLRTPIFAVTGITRKVSYVKFLMVDGSAAFISVPLWVYVGFWGAQQRALLLDWIAKGKAGLLVALAVIALLFIFHLYLNRWAKR